jgi:lipid-binding SYLF domain-containing protein
MLQKTSSLALAALLLAGTPLDGARAWDPEAEKKEAAAVEEALQSFKKTEPRLKVYFEQAYGYAIFPTVDKGGFIVGGAYGKGQVYVGNKLVGNATLSQGSIGLQVGFEAYSELIFFGDKAAFEAFKSGNAKFAAKATAYAIKAGAAAVANYSEGVAVFVKGKGGLMADASLGGQTFAFDPLPGP